MHALISVIKPLTTWQLVKGLQEYREACGGLGISSYSRLPSMIMDSNVMVTWEGDNNVLLQQTAKFLLMEFGKILQGEDNHYKTLYFLKKEPMESVPFTASTIEEFQSLEVLTDLMERRALFKAQNSLNRFQSEFLRLEGDKYAIWNGTQSFYLNDAAMYYGQLYIHNQALFGAQQMPVGKEKAFLENLIKINALNKIRESLGSYLGVLSNDQVDLMNTAFAQICEQSKYNIIASLEGHGVEDNTYRSALGAMDGNIYDRLIASIFEDRRNFGRPKYWKFIAETRTKNIRKMSKNGQQ